jgi:hypothetical protein
MPFDLEHGAFEPEATAAMGEAFKATCKELRDVGQRELVRKLIAKRIIAAATRGELDPVRLRVMALCGLSGAGDGREAGGAGAGQGGHDTVELLARVTRLAAKVGFRLDTALVVDASALCGFRGLGLRLGSSGHERDECIADSLLHRVLCRTVKGHSVNDRLDDDTAPHELADGVANISIVAPKPIDPAHHERVSRPQHVEQPAALRTLSEPCAHAADTFIGDHLVDLEPGLLGLGALVGGSLFSGGYAGVEHDHNAELRNADATRQPVPLGSI